MSTRCLIGKSLPNDQVKYIYCHNDGYATSGVGEKLLDHYYTEDSVDKLLSLGNLSVLGQNPIDAGEEAWRGDYDFTTSCRTYKSRGESGQEAKTIPFDDFENEVYDGIDYLYLFDDRSWYVRCWKNKSFSPLMTMVKIMHEDANTNQLVEEFMPVPESDKEWLEKKFNENNFNVVSKRDYGDPAYPSHQETHYQILSKDGNKTEEDFESSVNWLSDLLDDFEDMTGSPCTFNMGLQEDGYISAGLDLRAIYYKPGEDIRRAPSQKIHFRNGKVADTSSESVLKDIADKFGVSAEDIENSIPVDKSKKEKLEESVEIKSNTPYMLRNDGKLLECGSVHPYIIAIWSDGPDANYKRLMDKPEILQWFLDNSLNDETKEVIHDLKNNKFERLDDILEKLSDLTCKEFCKVRTSNVRFKYGGNNGKIYFRIPEDSGHNWFDDIWKVIMDNKDFITNVTVTKDEGTAYQDNLKLDYVVINDKKVHDMPVDEFLTLSGNPIVEEKEDINNIGKKMYNNGDMRDILTEKDLEKSEVRDILKKYPTAYMPKIDEKTGLPILPDSEFGDWEY